jgi:hypothetical protein
LEILKYAPRTAEQMNSSDFQLTECYWQQLTSSSSVWNEPIIAYQGSKMMAHPGFEAWQTKSSFLKVPLKLHNVSDGTDKKPGEDYENYTPPEFEAHKMSESYFIIGG